MFNMSYALIVFAVFVIALGQITFKYAALHLQFDRSLSYIALLQANFFPIGLVLFAMVMYAISTLAWVQALRTVPLSIAFSFNSLAFIIVPIASVLLFGEQLPRFFFIGAPLIVAGIIIAFW